MSPVLNVGDEEEFMNYAERMVFEMQSIWRTKDGLETFPVIDMSAKLEELIYSDALTDSNLSQSAHVWGKRECLIYYQETCEMVLRNLEYKQLNWKKICEDNEKNPRYVLSQILKEDDGRKHKVTHSAPKQMKARQVKPKAPKAASAAGGGVPKVKKPKGRQSNQMKAAQHGIAGMAHSTTDDVGAGEGDPMNIDHLISETNLDDFGFDFDADKNGDSWNF